MTKFNSPLIVAAHIHHSRARADRPHKENIPATGSVRRRHTTNGSPVHSARLQLGVTGGIESAKAGGHWQEAGTRARVPLSSLEDGGQSRDSAPSSDDPIVEGTSPSGSQNNVISASAQLASANRAQAFKSRTDSLDEHIEELEMLVHGFKSKVSAVVREFEGLKESISDILEEYEAMETDNSHSLAALEEEKATSSHRFGCWMNAELEILHLRRALPEDVEIDLSSQAKTLQPLYDLYA